jgi:RNA polymerase sigma-B factor
MLSHALGHLGRATVHDPCEATVRSAAPGAAVREAAPAFDAAQRGCRAAGVCRHGDDRGRPWRSLDSATLHRMYAQSHDPELEAELLRRHQGLAWQLAKTFSHRGEPVADLRQVASLALLLALRSYDPERGAQFTTYATLTIAGSLKRHFRDRGWLVRPPRRLQEAYLVVRAAVEQLEAQLARSPTTGEIAGATGLAPDDVIESLEAAGGRYAGSFEGPPRVQGGSAPDPVLTDDGAHVAHAEDRVLVAQLVGQLPKAERDVIALSFFLGLTQSEIATRLGMSQSTVSRLRRRALDQLRALHRDDDAAA